jgi:membrane protein
MLGKVNMRSLATLLLRIFKGYERKHLQLIAAGLAYFFLMSLFPALIVCTALAAYLPVQNGAQRTTSFIAHVMPPQALSLIQPVLSSIAPHRSGLLWLGTLTTLWLTSIGAKAIIAGLDIVYEVRTPRSLWLNRFLAFALTLGVGILLLIAVVLTLAGPVIESLLEIAVPLRQLWVTLWPYLQWLVAGTFTFAAIELLYLLAPNTPVTGRITTPGAFIAAGSWLAFSWGLSFFFHEFAESKLNALYGIFATPIAILTWLNWGAAAILLGAELNVDLQSLKDVKPTAEPGTRDRLRAA